MRRKQILMRMRWCTFAFLGIGALFLTSCARDGFDNDERFESGVSGVTLSSPAATDITVTPSADGKSQTISWPLIKGAGGFLVSFYDAGNMDEPIVADSILDGYSITIKREEDMNYLFTIRTLGNEKYNNTEAPEATNLAITTFTPTYATIPSGTDLKAWFEANPAPASEEVLNYDLEAGGSYTLSGLLELGATPITLRTNNKSDWASITFTGTDSEFRVQAGFILKYLNIDCEASSSALIGLSKTPAVAGTTVNAWGTDYVFYTTNEPIGIQSCRVDNVNSFVLTDYSSGTNVWFPKYVVVDNSIVHLTTSANNNNYAYFYTNNGGGFIKEMSVTNSTFYNTTEFGFRYFARFGGFALNNVQDTFGWTDNTLTYANSTFYNVCQNDGQWGNYNGIYRANTSFWVMTNCIFWNCSTSGSVPRRFLQGRGNPTTATFLNNTYMKKDGTFQDPQNYDQSGTNIEEDPGFADPANADFTISASSRQAALGTGDPRWLP